MVLSRLPAVWKGLQQDAQPDGPHAPPRRQQALQVPVLPQQVHPEGEPHAPHEGETRHHGPGPGRQR